jgi:hypothetical protein
VHHCGYPAKHHLLYHRRADHHFLPCAKFVTLGTFINVSEPNHSLPEAYRTVKVNQRNWFRRFLAFAGPGYLVSVGYMDPGNWATALGGGSTFGYTLLWVILCSSLMAMVLQTLCARLGIATGKDLAQACRDYVKRPAAMALWLLCEIAIISTDIAEVIGSAVALNLLFGLNLSAGVLITGLDVLVLLALMRFGFRKIEAIIFTLVATIFVCFGINIGSTVAPPGAAGTPMPLSSLSLSVYTDCNAASSASASHCQGPAVHVVEGCPGCLALKPGPLLERAMYTWLAG